MSKSIINIEGISKKYAISHQQGGYLAMRDVMTNALRHPFAAVQKGRNKKEAFWALKDINFEVNKGDIVGIIGRNGAGKSTLLKILSRITYPTAGKITMRGTVGSLLEVGTGFHPELTGRENIFLNGSILGMKRREIAKKFDEIVDFAGVEKFLDTPVKRYSSGMSVRLAFSVAAHLNPDILIVDEVLAVGDAGFQEKSMAKMKSVVNETGRTILLVSHNMSAIQNLCNNCILLSNGNIKKAGKPKEVIRDYLEDTRQPVYNTLADRRDRRGVGNIRFKKVEFLKTRGLNTYAIGDDLVAQFTIQNKYPGDSVVRLAMSIGTEGDFDLISCDSMMKGRVYTLSGSSESIVSCRVFTPPLNQGVYSINVAIFDGDNPEDWVLYAATFSVEAGQFNGVMTSKHYNPVLADFEWKV